MAFERLVRFKNKAGDIFYGEVPPEISTEKIVGAEVSIYEGDAPWDPKFRQTSNRETVEQILEPLPRVPIFVCVGLNYRQHATEAGFKIPSYPVLFNKPPASLAGPHEDIPIHPEAKLMDYEGELCVIIGKECKDLGPDSKTSDYILGYTAGNDVSSRYWQQSERSGEQAGYAKGFDKFAPIGPVICSPRNIPDPSKLILTTFVNGEERQRTETNDLIFDVDSIVRFCSVGHTLEPGTVIMTGTPRGVAAFMKPPAWLQDGDVVEVEISGIGKLRNKMSFKTSNP